MPNAQNPDPAKTVAAPSPDADPTAPGTARATNSEFNLSAPLAPGEAGALGPYRLVKELGRGGMGAVYLAVDTRLNRKLALKVMLPEFAANADAKERFLREARAAALVSHDNVVTVYEADERAGVPYIAMQLLSGCSLDEFLKKKGTPALHHVVRIATETALGLAAAHKLGLVHRDIKPANLWLESPNGRVKVLDFGLARPVDDQSEVTKSGAILGTPAYMSPEQARGRKVDARGDVFSLGAVLYRLLTGRTPFAGANVMEVLMALGSDEPAPVRELNPNVPEPLAVLVHRMLAKNPDARPQSAAEVARLLPLALAGGAPELSASAPVVVPVPVPMVVTASPENVFADLDADYESDADRTEALAQVSRPATGGKGPLIAVGVAVLLAAVSIGLLLALKGGPKPNDTANTDPPETSKDWSKPRPPGGGKKDEPPAPEPKKELPARKPPKPWVPPSPVPVGESPFDKLDPKAIPAEDKLNWHPDELVAVAGTHSPRTETVPLDEYARRLFAVSPDGARLVTGCGIARPLQIWNVKARTVESVWTPRPDYLQSAVSFSPDGKSLNTYTSHPGRWYDRWDLSALNRDPVAWGKGLPIDSHASGMWHAPDNSRLVIQSGSAVRVFNMAAKEPKELAKLPLDWHWDLGVSRDCLRIAGYSDAKKSSVVWDVTADGAKDVLVTGVNSGMLALSADGKKLVAWDAGQLKYFDLTSEKTAPVAFAGGAPNLFQSMAFNADGTRLVAHDADRALRLWDTSGTEPKSLWKVPLALHGSTPAGARVAFAGEGGKTLVALTGLGFIYFIDVSGDEPKVLNQNPPTEPAGTELRADGRTGRVALKRASDGRPHLWDFAAAKPVPTGDALPASPIAHTPDFKNVLAWEPGVGTVRWTDGKRGPTITPPSNVGVLSADGKKYWAETAWRGEELGRRVTAWDLSKSEARQLAQVQVPPGGHPTFWLRLVRNETVLAIQSGGDVVFLDVTAEEPKLLSQTMLGPGGRVFPDAERVLGQIGVGMRLWQLKERGWEIVWTGPVDANLSYDVHPSGKLFAVYAQGEISVYDADTFAKVRVIPYAAGKYPPQKIEFAPDGRHLFVINSFNTVYVLRMNELPDRARDPDRAAAEWVFSVGGSVQLASGGEARAPGQLPKEPFRLRTVVLKNAKGVTPEGVDLLRRCPELDALTLAGSDVTDAALARLAGMRLNHLLVMNSAIGDDGLAVVKTLKEVHDLHFENTRITDKGLAHLAGVKLNGLYLNGTAITDGGVPALAASDPRHLFLKGTNVTPAGVLKLGMALPNCTVTWDGGSIEAKK